MELQQDQAVEYPIESFNKHDGNPIIEPISDHNWESEHVYNPTIIVEDGTFKMLYRAEGPKDVSRIGLATSDDGIHFNRQSDPLIVPEYDYEIPGGCEDPRLTKINGTYYLTYTGYDGDNALLCLASSDNLTDWDKHGPLFPEFDGTGTDDDTYRNKAGTILPWKVDGRYIMYFGVPQIWYAESNDLIHWERGPADEPVISTETGTYMSNLVEPGPIPVQTKTGDILLIFAAYDGEAYTITQALLSGDDPTKMIDRLESPILEPETDAALSGKVDDVLFPEGFVINEGTAYLYYGMADSRIGVATYEF